ncbi:DUF4072 domain-containing protein, partial [Pantoea agglomerans]|uniref:DUF4072 domain-containing protein n=1 Tax=Enterobacter agglomerans TaxID=549 RepID=UPI001CA3D715
KRSRSLHSSPSISAIRRTGIARTDDNRRTAHGFEPARSPCAANRLQWRVRDAMARSRTGPAFAGGRPLAAHAIHSPSNHPVMTHNLVIQSLAPLSDAHHKPLLALSRGTRIVQTDDHALRIENASPAQRLDIDAYCGTH